MGWNTARVTLLPPRWKRVVTPSARARTPAGSLVHIAHSVRAEGTAGPVVGLGELCAWLAKRGFRIAEQSPGSVTLREEDVEAFLGAESDEVAEIILTFTLDRNSFSRVETWQQFIRDLCAAWPLALVDADRSEDRLTAGEFTRLLGKTSTWREFQEAFGWPPLLPPGGNGQGDTASTKRSTV